MRIKPGGDYLIAVNTKGEIFEAKIASASTDVNIAGSAGDLYSCGYSRDSTTFIVGGDTSLLYVFNATSRVNTL